MHFYWDSNREDWTFAGTLVRTLTVGSEEITLTTNETGSYFTFYDTWYNYTRETDGVVVSGGLMSSSPSGDMHFYWDSNFTRAAGVDGPITVKAMPNYVYQGEIIPYGTDYRRVAIDVRNDTVHIAASNAAAGVFY
jgi:hypothetical protein